MDAPAETWVCCASGSSAAEAGIDGAAAYPTIAVNDAWQIAPHARRLYAADYEWWSHHVRVVRERFAGELWTCDARAAREWKLNKIICETTHGLSKRQGVVRAGGQVGFSGAQAINMAYLLGARTILLVGFDMDGPQHFFGLHPAGLARSQDWPGRIRDLGRMAWELHQEGVRIWNCSPKSRIPYWPRMTLAAALARL